MTRSMMSMRRLAAVWVVPVALVLGLALIAAVAQAQPGKGGGRPGAAMGDPAQMMYAEMAWAACNFQCTLNDKQFTSLRSACQKAVDARNAAFEKARQAKNFEGVKKATDAAKKTLDTQIGKILTKEQLAKVTAWEQLARTAYPKIMQNQPAGDHRGMMSMFYIDQTWGALAFRIKATDKQIKGLRPTFAKAWADRTAALKTGDAKKVASVTQASRTQIEAKLKSVLTKDQMAKLAPPRGPGGPGGRGGKGGKGGKR